MSLEPKSILSLRVSSAVVFIVMWNVGLLSARSLGAPFSQPGLIVGGLTGLATAACAIAIVKSSPFRRLALHPSRLHLYRPGFFVFIALVTGLIGVAWMVGGVLGVFSELQPPSN